MDNLDEIREVFTAECSEILQKMESILLQMESGDSQPEEKIHELFRYIHTIKGSAGIFGYEAIVSFTHIVESLLDKIREGQLPFKKEMIALLLDARDHITELIESAANGNPLEKSTLKTQEKLVRALEGFLGKIPEPEGVAPQKSQETTKKKQESQTSANLWHISLRFKEDTIRNGLDPYSTFVYLNKVGEIIRLYTLTYRVPDIESIDPESCYLGFELLYKCDNDIVFIRDAFEFVQYDCDIFILPPNRKYEDYMEFFSYRKEPILKLARILFYTKSLDRKTLRQFNKSKRKNVPQSSGKAEPISMVSPVEPQHHSPGTKNGESEHTVNEHKATAEASKKEFRESKSIRIDSGKLDVLINLVGELVVSGANLTQIANTKQDSLLQETASRLNLLISDIRDTSLNLRMVQIGETFNRFHRVVRDISLELNKDVHLQISGGETELDKLVVEKINDPLMHLIRNSLDHGIEPIEERQAVGKPVRGNLSLHAFHEAGNIVIEVSDDGRGLNKEKILKKAIEKGLVSPEKILSDIEVQRLIFHAGFSTAEKVTNISGRGVGLDVVEKNIESLRGSITLISESGKGTTFQIRLPLTLAIIDGFLFRVAEYYYVVPLYQIVECIEFQSEMVDSGKNDFINLRGRLLPFLRLSEFFHFPESQTNIRKNILILQNMGSQVGLLVDSLHGEFQTVIKPLGKIFKNLRGISGTTVLGSGEVALILDVGLLFQRALNNVL